MVTIFDLQKGQEVWGGIMWGGPTPQNTGVSQPMKVRSIIFKLNGSNFEIKVRLSFDNNKVTFDTNLVDKLIYSTEEDFLNGVNPLNQLPELWGDIMNKTAEKIGLETDGSYLKVWKWDENKKCAFNVWKQSFSIDLLNFILPDGEYATKEACEKANKKLVKVKVETESIYELEPEDAEYLLQNPGEYADFDANIKEHSSFAQSVQ